MVQGKWAIALHGGAGVISKKKEGGEVAEKYRKGLRKAINAGKIILENGGTALDAVEMVVRELENSALFNAGKGSVLTKDATHELEASIMDGSTLDCGAVAGLITIKNPISLARLVMKKSRHVFLIGDGAEQFAEEEKVERMQPSYFYAMRRLEQWQQKLKEEDEDDEDEDPLIREKAHNAGTVGCVARDIYGNVAAATSTGGRVFKHCGRVGDTACIGCGTYANNKTCAISCTGVGEEFIKHTVAYDVSALVEYAQLDLKDAVHRVIHEKLSKGDGGLVAVGSDGTIVTDFNGRGMYRAVVDSEGTYSVRIWK